MNSLDHQDYLSYITRALFSCILQVNYFYRSPRVVCKYTHDTISAALVL